MVRKIFLGCLFCHLLTGHIWAQVFIEVGSAQNKRDAFGSVTVYGSDGLSRNVPYEKIKGTAFWQDGWTKAFFFDLNDKQIGSSKAKFNFSSQEPHFLQKVDTGLLERAAPADKLSAVVFMKEEDSSQIATVFRKNIEDVKKTANCKTCFVQELNQGHTKLLKITERIIKTGDSLYGTIKTYFFTDIVQYFVQTGDQYNPIRRLTKDYFFAHIPGSSGYSAWIKEKGLRFNKESDYLIFLEHYNATYQKD